MISLIGIPPTGGFFGKYQIFWSALHADMAPLAIALAINSVISTYYYWQVIRAAFVDEEMVWTRKLSPMGSRRAASFAVTHRVMCRAVFTRS
jgi:NADH:ubiquinone oxidoreductase subunit 2 (subunit N)